MSDELSIVVVLYHSGETLAACLRSVKSVVDRGWAELVAVDNASPDDSVEILRREVSAAKLVTLGENLGFAGGVNAATARASGRYWLLLNPDVVVPPGGLESLVAWMDHHPHVGVASPDLTGTDGVWQAPGRALPSFTRTLFELTRLHRALPPGVRGRLLRGPYWAGADQVDAGWVPGTAMIVRAAAAREVGPLREDFFMYGEDLEFCWRMRRGGWRVGVCSGTTFEHTASTSARVTFGANENEARIAAGMDTACRLMYGPTRARALATLTALALAVESRMPGRNSAYRARVRATERIWKGLARHGSRGGNCG
jgi:N-acetylglucosaminyl-diphospho-decaprenol L-rhamnosyltransferase